MPTPLGKHNAQLANVRELLLKKGRQEQNRFAFEGPTLLAEARAAGTPVEAVYVTREAFERYAEVAAAESAGIPVFIVDHASMARISDVETPPGIVAIAPIALHPFARVLDAGGAVAIFAGIQDPGNAGTLMRSAEAFGIGGIIFDPAGVEPHHPKVVRAAMGALFRLCLAVAPPAALGRALDARTCVGLDARGTRIDDIAWGFEPVIVVGSERRGLGAWRSVCGHIAAIPMAGPTESLNASVAGSIAFYEATKLGRAGA